MREVQWSECSNSWSDADVFDSKQQQNRPDQINPRCRQYQSAQRHLWRGPFRRQRHANVPDEHMNYLCS
jgi:hypothetical protein